MIITDWSESHAIPLPIVYHLDRLETEQPLFVPGAAVSEKGFRSTLSFFGTIARLLIHGPNVLTSTADNLDSRGDMPLVATKIQSVTAREPSSTSTAMLRPIANLLGAALIATLDLTYVSPEDIVYLARLISVCSANLCTLVSQLEPSNGPECTCDTV